MRTLTLYPQAALMFVVLKFDPGSAGLHLHPGLWTDTGHSKDLQDWAAHQ